MLIGMKSALALAAGGTLVLIGLVSLTLLSLLATQTIPEQRRSRHILTAIMSVLLVAVGGLVLLGVGIIYPIHYIKFIVTYNIDKIIKDLDSLEIAHRGEMLPYRPQSVLDSLEIANRLRCAQAIQAILGQPKYQNPKKLNRHEYKVFSQNGEDGIIAEIFRRIGTTNRYFVEFGSSDGMENNTVLLLRRQSWGGLWIDGDHEAVGRANKHFRPEIAGKKLAIIEAFITAENIEDLFRRTKVPEEFDLLSIDIDRNDYYVWEKIVHYRPRVVIVEYNALYPPTISWVIPYDPKAMWAHTSHFGASLKALEELGAKKGYSLVGCNISGVNAFFVRDDLLGDHFAEPCTADNHYEPSRYDLFLHDSNHPRVP
jgi:hypothetical protein